MELKQEEGKQTQLRVESLNNVHDGSMVETGHNVIQGTTSDIDDNEVSLSLEHTQSKKDEALSVISFLSPDRSVELQGLNQNFGFEENDMNERLQPRSQVEIPSSTIPTVKPVSVEVYVCPDHFGEDISRIKMRRFEGCTNNEILEALLEMAQILHGVSDIEALVYASIKGKYYRADKLPENQRVSLIQTWKIKSPRGLMYSFARPSPLEAVPDRPVTVGSRTSVGGRPPEHVNKMSADFDGSPPEDTGQFVFGYRPEVDSEGLTVSVKPSDADNDEGVADTGQVTMTQDKVLIQVIFKLQFPNGDWPENRLSYKVWVSYPFCNLMTDLWQISSLIAGEAVRSTLEYKQWGVADYQQLPDLSAVHSSQHLDIPEIVGNSLKFIVKAVGHS